MIIAVLADIHGNEAALVACLEHAERQGAERYLFLGDYAGELPWPERVMDRLYRLAASRACAFIRGNKEDYWLNADPSWQRGCSTTGMLWYNMQHLRQKDLNFYRSLPYTDILRLPGLPPVKLCHGTPEKTTEKMKPDDEKTMALMERDECPLILFAHSHAQLVIKHQSRAAVNPGSVGVPLGSGGRTEYMLLEGEKGGWTHRMVALEYDTEGELAAMREAGLFEIAPAWSRITAYVLRHGTFGHAAVLRRAMDLCRKQNGDCVWPRIPEACWQQAMDEMLI